MMKSITTILLVLMLAMNTAAQSLLPFGEEPAAPQREVRAVWLTTLKGLDWPHKTANTYEETINQQKELLNILDKLAAAGINTVFFQTRIRSTTAYPSNIEPWDGVFTGIPGKAPLYDPLQFALDECHRRGMELHAWVVAYPICSVEDAKKLGKKALPSLYPELCQRCGNQWMMDPGVPGTDQYIANICEEIVRKYKVDGIHLDYIRYPESGIPFDDNRTYRKYGKPQNKSQWRSDNVTRTVLKIHSAVKSLRPWVKISCSPVGKYADLQQQSSYGWNARDAVHQRAQDWLRDGLMDMLTPMMYFDGKHFYPFLQDWLDHSYGRQIVPGLGIYLLHERQRNWKLSTISRQMYFSRQTGCAGQVHFRSLFFTDNVKGLYDFAKNGFYATKVLSPAMTWQDSIAPTQPEASISAEGLQLKIKWSPAKDNKPATPLSYNVYLCPTDTFDRNCARALAMGIKDNEYTMTPALPALLHSHYAVTAVDAFGNESTGKAICALQSVKPSFKFVVNNQLDIPSFDHSEYLLITDISGRPVLTIRHTDSINIQNIEKGYYEIRTLGKKGHSHRIGRFWKN